MRMLPCIVLLVFTMKGIGQSASKNNLDITLTYSTGKIPLSQGTYDLYNLGLKRQYQKTTISPLLSYKNAFGFNGLLMGAAIYQKADWGYFQLSTYYSPSEIFAKYTFNGQLHYNAGKGIVPTAGYRSDHYHNGIKRNTINIGSTYYGGSFMFALGLSKAIAGEYSQKVLLRKFLRNPKDFLQLAFYSGRLEDFTVAADLQTIRGNTFQVAFYKSIFKKTQVQISLSIFDAAKAGQQNEIQNFQIGFNKEI